MRLANGERRTEVRRTFVRKLTDHSLGLPTSSPNRASISWITIQIFAGTTNRLPSASPLQSVNEEVEGIGKDQERLRDNIKALTATAEARQVITRYVAKADTQETRLEQLDKEKQTLTESLARLQKELEVLVRSLTIDQRL